MCPCQTYTASHGGKPMSGVLRAMPCCHPQCLNTPESAHTSKTCSTACLPSSQYHKLCGSWPTALDPYPPAHTDNIYTQIIMNTLTIAPQISNICIPDLQIYIDIIYIRIMYNVYRTFHNHCLDSQSSSDIITDHYLRWILVPSIGLSKML